MKPYLSLIVVPAFFLGQGLQPLYGESIFKRPAYNEVAVDLLDGGGGFLMVSRMLKVDRSFHAGIVVGGGYVERDLPFLFADGKTKSFFLPYIGPRVNLHFKYLDFSVAYGIFYAESEFDVSGNLGNFHGEEKAWGTAFYFTFFDLNFTSDKHGLTYGFGFGLLAGESFPQLEATSPSGKVTTDATPIDTNLTLHLKIRWDGRKK